jgi:hypothetical protein
VNVNAGTAFSVVDVLLASSIYMSGVGEATGAASRRFANGVMPFGAETESVSTIEAATLVVGSVPATPMPERLSDGSADVALVDDVTLPDAGAELGMGTNGSGRLPPVHAVTAIVAASSALNPT